MEFGVIILKMVTTKTSLSERRVLLENCDNVPALRMLILYGQGLQMRAIG